MCHSGKVSPAITLFEEYKLILSFCRLLHTSFFIIFDCKPIIFKAMKEKATFLSYISAEKRLRKEQLKKNHAAKSGNQQNILEKPHPSENIGVSKASYNY